MDCAGSKHQFNCKPKDHQTMALLVIFEHDDVFEQVKEPVFVFSRLEQP
jgi:hypothetical protein